MKNQVTEKTITVSKNDIIKAVEFKCSSAYSKPESWMYFKGVFCMDFFHTDEKPSINDFDSSGYRNWLKYNGESDTDENFELFLEFTHDHFKGLLLDNLIITDSDENITDEIKVIYQ